jgi:hypothetical protein
MPPRAQRQVAANCHRTVPNAVRSGAIRRYCKRGDVSGGGGCLVESTATTSGRAIARPRASITQRAVRRSLLLLLLLRLQRRERDGGGCRAECTATATISAAASKCGAEPTTTATCGCPAATTCLRRTACGATPPAATKYSNVSAAARAAVPSARRQQRANAVLLLRASTAHCVVRCSLLLLQARRRELPCRVSGNSNLRLLRCCCVPAPHSVQCGAACCCCCTYSDMSAAARAAVPSRR